MGEKMDQQFADAIPVTPLVAKLRKSIVRARLEEPTGPVDIGSLHFGSRCGGSFQVSCALFGPEYRRWGRPFGVIEYSMEAPRRDLVGMYLCLAACDGQTLEIVELRDAPRRFQVYAQGTAVGTIERIDLDHDPRRPAESWFAWFWRRFLRSHVLWKLYAAGELVGTVDLKYPPRQLDLQLVDGTVLPIRWQGIGLSSYLKGERECLRPPGTKRPAYKSVECMYYGISLLLRFRVLHTVVR